MCKGNPQPKCRFHLQIADSTYNLSIPHTVADSATAQFKDANVLSFVYGFHKLFWMPQIMLQCCGFRDKSDFGLLQIPLTMRRKHSLAS